MDEKGTVYFFTGLSGAGKTTIGGLFYKRLKMRRPDAVLVDGDHARNKVGDHDYSTEARRRGAYVQMAYCQTLADQGLDVVLCSISMYRDVREWARANIDHYREIYVKASMETLCRRDQKGLYTKIRKDVVGVDLPWDEPENPDVVIENEGGERPEDIVARLERQFWGSDRTNVALIIAGGNGHRMHNEIPKQFLNVDDKPVIIYTLECFQRHPEIDGIAAVCLDGWTEILRAYTRQFGITKLKWVVPGGQTAQESIRNGVLALRDACGMDDIVVIHDGIRPLVDDYVLSDVLVKCRQYGNAVASLPYNEQIFLMDDEQSTVRYIPRDTLRRVSTPQAYLYGKLLWAYEKAFSEGIGIQASTYANTLMSDLGERLYFAAGSEKNIKLTTPDDLKLFRSLLAMKDPAGVC